MIKTVQTMIKKEKEKGKRSKKPTRVKEETTPEIGASSIPEKNDKVLSNQEATKMEVTKTGKDLTAKQYFQRDFLCKFLLASMTSGFIVVFNAILLTYQCIRKQELCAFHDFLVKTTVISIED